MLSPGLMHQLGVLVKSYEGGSSAVEYMPREFWNKRKYSVLRRQCRRCRILMGRGLATEVRAVQSGHEAYRVSPRGLALWDQLTQLCQ